MLSKTRYNHVSFFFLGLLRYKVDFQSLQLEELENGDEFDLDDYWFSSIVNTFFTSGAASKHVETVLLTNTKKLYHQCDEKHNLFSIFFLNLYCEHW